MEITFVKARARLNDLLDRVTQDRETVIITRPNRDDVALIAADELSGLLETVHLLRSPLMRHDCSPPLSGRSQAKQVRGPSRMLRSSNRREILRCGSE